MKLNIRGINRCVAVSFYNFSTAIADEVDIILCVKMVIGSVQETTLIQISKVPCGCNNWTSCLPTVFLRLLKWFVRRKQSCFICRHTAPTSILLKNYSSKLKYICANTEYWPMTSWIWRFIMSSSLLPPLIAKIVFAAGYC